MQILAQLNQSARLLALAGLHSQYPQSSETELQRRLAGLLLGEEIACKVYGKLTNEKLVKVKFGVDYLKLSSIIAEKQVL